jgi:prophage regulatory protein
MKFELPTAPQHVLVRTTAAPRLMGGSLSDLYDKASRGLMTRPVKVGARASAIPLREIEAVNAARIRGASDDEIRALVSQLHADRSKAA